MQPVFAALVPLRFQDGAGGGVDGVLVLAEVVVELDLILGAAVVMVELGLDKVDPQGAQARVLQGNPWVFRSDIDRVSGAWEPGDVVSVKSARGRMLGWAF